MPVVRPTTVPSKRLSASISSSATSFQTSDRLRWSGEPLEASDFGDEAYGCFRDPNGTVLELFEFDPATIQDESISFVRRGLNFTGDRTTEVDALMLEWVKGTTIVELGTTMPQFFQWLKEYIDAAAIAGGVPADEDTLGIVKTSVAPVSSLSPVAVGDNDTRIIENAYGVSAAGTDSYAITLSPSPGAYAAGQVFAFKADVANTGAATLNVNAIGPIALRKHGTTVLTTNDIVAGQIVVVQYDGTNFQIVSQMSPILQTVVATNVYSSGTVNKDLSEANGATTVIAHGLGVVPRLVRLASSAVDTGSGYSSSGSWRSNTHTAIYFHLQKAAESELNAGGSSTAFALRMYEPGDVSAYQDATVSVDATNITLTWAKTGTPTGTFAIVWEAEGYTTASVT